MSLNFKDANKNLTRALFMLGADKFEQRFTTNPKEFRALFIETLKIAIPQASFEQHPEDPGLIRAAFNDPSIAVREITVSVANVFALVSPIDLVRSRDITAKRLMELANSIDQKMKEDPNAHIRGPLMNLVFSDEDLADLNSQLAPATVISWQISPNLNAIACVDIKSGVAYLTDRSLIKLGLTEEQAKDKALKTMKKRMVKAKIEITQSGGALLVTGFEGWTQSLLSLPDFTQGLRHRLDDDVVLHVGDDLIVAAKRSDPVALTDMARLAGKNMVKPVTPGSFFLVQKDGLSTVTREDIDHMVSTVDYPTASYQEPISPTFN